MGHFETYPIWDKITKEEYELEKQKIEDKAKTKGIWEGALLRIQFNELYQARHTYDGGLIDQINGTAKITHTEYLKRKGQNTYYLCGSKEYEYLKNNGLL